MDEDLKLVTEIMQDAGINIEDYDFKVFWSDEDDCYIGICAEFESLSAFGYTEFEAMYEIKFVVSDMIVDRLENNEPIIKPQKFVD